MVTSSALWNRKEVGRWKMEWEVSCKMNEKVEGAEGLRARREEGLHT